jgi:hypothetical protein
VESFVPERVLTVEEICTVEGVQVLSEGEQNGKPLFSVLLELGTLPDPSIRKRRNVKVKSLALGVEEREIPILARLSGRTLALYLDCTESHLQKEALQDQVLQLKSELDSLRERNAALRNNLHHLVEQTR